MALPGLNESGDLPIGIHRATLSEVLQRFGHGSLQRKAVASRLERIYAIAAGAGNVFRFIVFGSFVTDQVEPNDVDVLMIMDDTFDADELSGEAKLLFDHQSADVHFGASVFWIRRMAVLGDVESMVEFWQTKRGGGRRGIVEICEDGQ